MVKKFIGLAIAVLLLNMLFVNSAVAEGSFSVQVSPSPLIATLRPGELSTLDLRINNTGTEKETYVMDLRNFTVDEKSGQISIGNDRPASLDGIVSFAQPEFSLESGEWMTQRISVNVPEDAGFSLYFAILVKKQGAVEQPSGAAIEGSVAVFTLLNIDKPGATRSLEITSIKASKRVYEYLPAELTVGLKNTGNTIIAPDGNIFIGRSLSDTSMASVPVNKDAGNILPGATREFTVRWTDGFPLYETKDGNTNLVWNYSNLSSFQIGRFSAKAILIYDDGERDVPLEASVSFWVIPWKIIIGGLLIIMLLIVGILTVLKKSTTMIRKKKAPVE